MTRKAEGVTEAVTADLLRAAGPGPLDAQISRRARRSARWASGGAQAGLKIGGITEQPVDTENEWNGTLQGSVALVGVKISGQVSLVVLVRIGTSSRESVEHISPGAICAATRSPIINSRRGRNPPGETDTLTLRIEAVSKALGFIPHRRYKHMPTILSSAPASNAGGLSSDRHLSC